jgi:hypothetical protein
MTHPYATTAYAGSLGHVGRPMSVPAWGGQVLVRSVAGESAEDAIGPYPLMLIDPAAALAEGMEQLHSAGMVSVVGVLDDQLRPPLERLAETFDFVRPFKTHYLYDRSLGPLAYGKHHRYEVRRAHARVDVRPISLGEHAQAWRGLYTQLEARHGVGGVHAFPAEHHETLNVLPGLRAFAAFVDERMVSAHLFVAHDGYAVSHLAASAPEGYETGAAYAVNDLAIADLVDCEVINFGGGAGFADNPADGLVRFKAGFSNRTAPSYLCGKVLDPKTYASLSDGYGDRFFPAYRGARMEAGQ